MIEKEIPKEINAYEAKYISKFTMRQNIVIGLMLAINFSLYFIGRKYIHPEIINWLMLLVASLAGAVALWKPNQQDFEKVVWYAIQSEILYPKKRPYKTENFFTEMREEYIAEQKEIERGEEQKAIYKARRERLKNNRIVRLFARKQVKENKEEIEMSEQVKGEMN